MSASLEGRTKSPLSGLLKSVSAELCRLRETSLGLEAVIAEVAAESRHGTSDRLRELQKIDSLIQELEGLADYTATIATATPPDWYIDDAGALRRMKMRSQVNRLARINGKPAVSEGKDVDLFDTALD